MSSPKDYALKDTVKLIIDACIQLRCSVRTRCKALFIYHHFQSCVSGMTYDPPLVAAACINLSVKSNGEKIELDAILMTFLCMFDKEKERKSTLKQEFKILKNSLIMMECLILRMTDFNLNHRLVHDYITYFLFDISHELTTMNLWNVICESCMKIASDFYFSDRCVCYKAEEIASATIQAAFYLAGIDVETECDRMKSWFKHVKECSKKLDIFEDIFKICMIGPVAESGK